MNVCLVTALLAVVTLMPVRAQNYSARKAVVDGISIVQLTDRQRDTTVSIIPSVGNNAYEMTVAGKNIFWFPYESVADFAADPKLCGNPFLAPWANRVDGEGFYANGQYYQFNDKLGNIRRDGNQLPIHGLLLYSSQWEVVSVDADGAGARATSRLRFSRHADLMAQFPFAHTIEMTYLLQEGTLEVRTHIQNEGAHTMPLSIGYHPYFRLHDAPRDSWTVSLAAERIWKLSEKLIPTGETRPVGDVFATPRAVSLSEQFLDHVFGGLVRDASAQAVFSVRGKNQQLEVIYGPNYRAAVVYAPLGDDRDFICFEPMSGITNAFNLAHRGAYEDLQTVPPGGSWEESYWIRPSGF